MIKFHSLDTLKKYGLKQKTTHIGIIVLISTLIYTFRLDLLNIVHSILNDADVQKTITGCVIAAILILFNKWKGKQ